MWPPTRMSAAGIDESWEVEIHALRFDTGRHRPELIGKGSFGVLGVVPASVELKKR
jgi:hypothetical protein